jgi:hypothetical protein
MTLLLWLLLHGHAARQPAMIANIVREWRN